MVAGTAMSPAFLAHLAQDIANVAYFKIELPGAANKRRSLIVRGGEAIVGPGTEQKRSPCWRFWRPARSAA